MIIHDKKERRALVQQENIRKVRAYNVDKSEHYKYVKRNGFMLEN